MMFDNLMVVYMSRLQSECLHGQGVKFLYSIQFDWPGIQLKDLTSRWYGHTN